MAESAWWYLCHLDLFERLPQEVRERLRSRSRIAEFAGRTQIELRADGADVYVLASGCAKLLRVGWLGRRIVDDLLVAGDVFGRVTLGSRSAPRELQTVEATRVLCVAREDFLSAMRDASDFAFHVTQLIEQRERRLERRIESLLFKDVRTRVIETIVQLARDHGDRCEHGWAVDVRVNQQDIADLVGASRQIVSRVLRELEFKLYLRRKGRVICIISLARLTRLCDGLA